METVLEILMNTGATLGGVSLIAFVFRENIRAFLTAQMHKEVNKHKQELDILTENIKYELQRDMIKAQLYTQSAHSIYPELYKKLLAAAGAITGLMGLRRVPDYTTYAPDDVKELLERREVSKITIDDIVQKHTTNRKDGADALNRLMRNLELNEAENTFREAKNFWLINELYLDDAISKKMEGLFKDLWSVYVDAEMAIQYQHTSERDKEAKKRVDPLLKELKDLIREQLQPNEVGKGKKAESAS